MYVSTVSSSVPLYLHLLSKTHSMTSYVRFRNTSFFDSTFQLFKNISFDLKPNQNWAIVGSVGSGRTSFLKCLAGGYTPSPATSFSHPYFREKNLDPYLTIQFLDFKETGTQAAAYYTERYHSLRDPEHDRTLEQWLKNAYHGNQRDASAAVKRAADSVRLTELLPYSIINLSNGQSRAAMLAAKLLRQPEMLLIDEPYSGMDVKARKSFSEIFGELSNHNCPKIVLSLREQDETPEYITHILQLNNRKVVYQGPSDHFMPQVHSTFQKPETIVQHNIGKPLVVLKDVNCQYYDRSVLRTISWTIREGERWALRGANGSGKTTLLAFVVGDHPKAFAVDVKYFGTAIGPGSHVSILDLQQNIGHTSPEIFNHFPKQLTVMQTLLSAWNTNFRPVKETDERVDAIQRILSYFQLQKYAQTPLSELSIGLQRFFLFCRACVKQPKLLILDEPFQGVDTQLVQKAHCWLNDKLLPSQAMVIISHYDEEIPSCVNASAQLEQGKLRITVPPPSPSS
ncbi:ATPase [Schizosaccharomyces japonicus yFS275]|uniref:ATPase n=1 Tax=Schizosaccharomyces japonicus (strain yFS275 / FY16936) TaxID=402676 RepID=B6K5H4_SCHJY|nr:ATPase [Schizosaccharomyces japonicus yFS275]EEB08778.2 ATPase [Schizosaccharomyces japonicus yFS275]